VIKIYWEKRKVTGAMLSFIRRQYSKLEGRIQAYFFCIVFCLWELGYNCPNLQHLIMCTPNLHCNDFSSIKLMANCFGIYDIQVQGFFKENVRYLVWICRDPISLILGTRFSLILGTWWKFSLILGTRIRSLKRLKKTCTSDMFLLKNIYVMK